MKGLHSRAVISAVFLFVSLFLHGCADTPHYDWDKRIGNYSYDDMRSDFGEPWKIQIAADGSKTCDWPVFIRQSWHTHTDYNYTYGRDDFPIASESNTSGGLKYFYRMTFDAKGLLIKWQTVGR